MASAFAQKKLRVYDAQPVGAVCQSPVNLESMTQGQWIALDGRDCIRSQFPEIQSMFPAGVFTSTARTLSDAPAATSIDAGTCNGVGFFLASGSVGVSALIAAQNGTTDWAHASSTAWAASTQWNSVIYNKGTSQFIVAGSGGDAAAPYIIGTNAGAVDPGKLASKNFATITTGGTTTTLTQGLAYAPFIVSVTAGSFVSGARYRITSIGSTDFTLIGAASNTVGVEFTATGVGAGTGTALTGRTVLCRDTSLATASGLFYMNDGATVWNACSGGSTADRRGVCWTGKYFIATTATVGLIQVSSDGVTWVDQNTIMTSTTPSAPVSDGNGTVVINQPSTYAFYVSKDHGATWRVILAPAGAQMNLINGPVYESTILWGGSISYVNAKFIIPSGSAVKGSLISSDGLAWFTEPIQARGSLLQLGGVAYAYKAGTYCGIKAGTTSALTATEDMSKFKIPYTGRGGAAADGNIAASNDMTYIKVRSN